jgi:hypothetical protein
MDSLQCLHLARPLLARSTAVIITGASKAPGHLDGTKGPESFYLAYYPNALHKTFWPQTSPPSPLYRTGTLQSNPLMQFFISTLLCCCICLFQQVKKNIAQISLGKVIAPSLWSICSKTSCNQLLLMS